MFAFSFGAQPQDRTNPETRHKSLILLFTSSALTALDGYVCEGWSQRISAQEKVRAGEWRDGSASPRYACRGREARNDGAAGTKKPASREPAFSCIGGEGGIRTLGTRERTPDFESGPFGQLRHLSRKNVCGRPFTENSITFVTGQAAWHPCSIT